MHIYAFGSICRGDLDNLSDIDLLAIVDGYDERFNSNDYSIYSYHRVQELWQKGNPFAWHLYLESKMIYSSNDEDFLRSLGGPQRYIDGYDDCQKFYDIFMASKKSLEDSHYTAIFDLSSVFLCLRNISTCSSLSICNKPIFSRNAAFTIGQYSLSLDKEIYHLYERARILCTRGQGDLLTDNEILKACSVLVDIENWMLMLMEIVKEKNCE